MRRGPPWAGERRVIAYDSISDECMQRYGQEVLESFINRTIIDQACRKQGISITQAEVNDEIVKIAKKFDIDPQNWLALFKANVTERQYKEDIIWPMLALKRLAGSEVKITEEGMHASSSASTASALKRGSSCAISSNGPRKPGTWS